MHAVLHGGGGEEICSVLFFSFQSSVELLAAPSQLHGEMPVESMDIGMRNGLRPDSWKFRHNRKSEKGDEPVLINCSPSKHTIDICNDQKLYKEIIVPGIGDEIPHKGVEVYFRYIAYLANKVCFGQTDGPKPTKFTIGDPEADVIKALHLGIPTMKLNELATFIIHPDLGFGPKGLPPQIPGNATLYFEIELLGWEGEDVTADGTREVLRKRMRDGPNKNVIPNDGAWIKVALEGFFEGRKFDRREIFFPLGEGEEYGICQGVEQALYKFMAQEVSRLTILPALGFGSLGNEAFGIPPNATITYVVELLSLERAKEVWEIDGQEKLEVARCCKEKAINYFRQGKYRLAGRLYKRITDHLTAEAFLVGADEFERTSLMCNAHLNQSLCHLKLEEYQKALHSADDALKFDSNSEKGLFRKGLANLGLGNPEEAKTNFEKLLNMFPTNKSAQYQLQVSIRDVKNKKEHDRTIYARMFPTETPRIQKEWRATP